MCQAIQVKKVTVHVSSFSDNELWEDEQPQEESRWKRLMDIFYDSWLDIMHVFCDVTAKGCDRAQLPIFASLGAVFSHFFYRNMISKIMFMSE